MIRFLRKLLYFFAALWLGILCFCEFPVGQNLLRLWIVSVGQKANLSIECGHIDVFFPFSIRIQDIRVLKNGEELVSCEKLLCVPLFIDIPLGRITILRLKGRGIEIDADRMESLTLEKDEDLPYSVSLYNVRLTSVHVTSKRIPDGGVDCSVKGRVFVAADLEKARCSLSCWRATPSIWPKRVDISAKKNGCDWCVKSSLYLSTEGLSSPLSMLTNTDDRFDSCVSFSTANKNLSGTWELACPSTQISPFASSALVRYMKATGTLAYIPEKECRVTCTSLEAVFAAGSTVQAIQDPESPAIFREDLLRSFATLRIEGEGSLHAESMTDKSLVFQVNMPHILVNERAGSVAGTITCQLSEKGIVVVNEVKATVGTEQMQFQGKMNLDDVGFEASCDFVSSVIRSSVRYQKENLSQKVWSFFRIQDISFLLPSFQGVAEISAHAELDDDQANLSISGHLSDIRSEHLSCHNADLSLSSNLKNFKSVSIAADITEFHYGCVQLDQAHFASSYDTYGLCFPSLECHLLGTYSLLPFDIFIHGNGQSTLVNGQLVFDRFEGLLANHAVTIEEPFILEHSYAMITKLQANINCSRQGRLHINWDTPSLMKGFFEGSCEHFPLSIIARVYGIENAEGVVDAQCHYQAEPRFTVGTANYSATVQRFGVFGGEEGGLAIGGTATLRDNSVSANLCAAGKGVHEPVVCSFICPIRRIEGTPFVFIPPTARLQGSIKGVIQLSQLLSRWRSGQAGLDGRIGCNLTIDGTYEIPRIKGPVHVRHGRVDVLPTGEVIEHISIDGELTNRFLRVDSVTATDGKEGKISGTGSVELTPQGEVEWKTAVSCTNVDIVDLDYANVVADGFVHLSGTESSLHISGSAQATRAIIDLAARFPSDVPEIPVIYKGGQKEPSPFNVTFDLHFDASAVIRGRGVSSLWTGQLQLKGPVKAIEVFGQLSCQKGSFLLGSKELSMTEGTITLAGDLFRDSRFNVRADISMPAIAAQVFLRGSLETPKFAIQSMPPRPDNEILSLLLFNKEFGDVSALESLQLANTALSLEQSSGPFELIDRIKQTLGIDVIDIGATSPLPLSNQSPTALDPSDASTAQQQLQNDVSLKVGKYISDGVAITVSKDVSTDANRVGFEAQVSKEVSACAAIGDDAEGVISIKWKHHY